QKLTHGYVVRALAVSPDGTKLASSSLDNTVRLWEIASGRAIYTLLGHGRLGGNRAVGFTPDGQAFLSWGDDMCLRKWDVQTGKLLLEHVLGTTRWILPDGREAGGARRDLGRSAFLPDGTAFVLNTDEQYQVFDVATGREQHRMPKRGLVTALAVSP